jgi:hypothetical protein
MQIAFAAAVPREPERTQRAERVLRRGGSSSGLSSSSSIGSSSDAWVPAILPLGEGLLVAARAQ